MADTSGRIIILSAVVLVIIILLPNSGLVRTSVTIDDLEVEIDTSRDYYYLGDSFTANVYLVNNGSKDVWMESVSSFSFSGVSENDPEPAIGIVDISWVDKFHIPVNSKAQLLQQDFKPKFLGEFTITCLGARKSVLIIDPPSEGETVSVMMNKHSFMNTDKATLYFANVGPNLILWGRSYTIEREVDQDWIEVSPLPPNSAWTTELILLPPSHTSSQKINIDTFESGLYRVSKTFEDSVTEESITLIVEFEIRGYE